MFSGGRDENGKASGTLEVARQALESEWPKMVGLLTKEFHI